MPYFNQHKRFAADTEIFNAIHFAGRTDTFKINVRYG